MPLDFPFLASLPKKQQLALQIAERIRETGGTIAQAAKWVTGRTWGPSEFATQLTAVEETMAGMGVASAETEALVTVGTEAVAAESAVVVGGGSVLATTATAVGEAVGLTGTAATVVGGGIILAVAGLIAYGASSALGIMSADSPTEPGPAMMGQAADPVVPPQQTTMEPYAVWLLHDVSGGAFWIGQESVIRNTDLCDWPGGGLCKGNGQDQPSTYSKMQGDFANAQDATSALCSAMSDGPHYWQLSHSFRATAYGKQAWLISDYCVR